MVQDRYFRKIKSLPDSIWRLEEVEGARTSISLAELKSIFEAERYEQIALNGLDHGAQHANNIIEGIWRIVVGQDDPLETTNVM